MFDRIRRLMTLARVAAGVTLLAVSAWWALRAFAVWLITRPLADAEFGLRITPLTPDESRQARDLEAELLPPSVVLG